MFSDLERHMIREPLEVRGFKVEFDDENRMLVSTKGEDIFRVPYIFYEKMFGKDPSADENSTP